MPVICSNENILSIYVPSTRLRCDWPAPPRPQHQRHPRHGPVHVAHLWRWRALATPPATTVVRAPQVRSAVFWVNTKLLLHLLSNNSIKFTCKVQPQRRWIRWELECYVVLKDQWYLLLTAICQRFRSRARWKLSYGSVIPDCNLSLCQHLRSALPFCALGNVKTK